MIELIYLIVVTHVSTVCSSLYLHRGLAHRLIKFHPVLEHLMRLWLWMTAPMNNKQWVAIHRLHHHRCEQIEDPHSPVAHGFLKSLIIGSIPYYRAAVGLSPLKSTEKNHEFVNRYGKGPPEDWIEKKLYNAYSYLGIILMLVINIILFEAIGLIIWIVQMLWVPLIAACIINGLSHLIGYRNYDTDDNSHNLMPWGIIVAGEELHNNHHKHPTQAKQSHKAGEFDLGWFYLTVLIKLKLAKLTTERAI